MAGKSAKKNSSKGKGSGKSAGSKSTFIGIIILIFCLLLIFEAISIFKTPEAEKIISAQFVGQFTGTDQSCGKFSGWDVAAAGNDKIAVTDQVNSRILFFDRTGKFLKSWGQKGEKPEDLKEPSGITSDAQGNVYFIDAWKSSIIELTPKEKIGLTVDLSRGFYGPRGVAFDGSYFYVADTGTHRVAKVSPQGELIASWGGGRMGSGKGDLNNPRSLAVDSQGTIYVADFENSRVQVLDSKGKFINTIKAGNKVSDVAVDASGRLFVASMDGNFVKVYSKEGKYLGTLKDSKGSDALFRSVSGMCFMPDGVLVLTGNDLVAMFRVP